MTPLPAPTASPAAPPVVTIVARRSRTSWAAVARVEADLTLLGRGPDVDAAVVATLTRVFEHLDRLGLATTPRVEILFP
jgi:hypothetical protein